MVTLKSRRKEGRRRELITGIGEIQYLSPHTDSNEKSPHKNAILCNNCLECNVEVMKRGNKQETGCLT